MWVTGEPNASAGGGWTYLRESNDAAPGVCLLLQPGTWNLNRFTLRPRTRETNAGSDDEEEDAEAVRVHEERLAAYKAKKEAKPKVAAKSVVTLDVKPWGMIV